MATLKQLEADIVQIKERNRRVEIDKAWETSWTRRILIAGLTYIIIVIFFSYAGFPQPFLSVLVPVAGFILSTLTLAAAKEIWTRYLNK